MAGSALPHQPWKGTSPVGFGTQSSKVGIIMVSSSFLEDSTEKGNAPAIFAERQRFLKFGSSGTGAPN